MKKCYFCIMKHILWIQQLQYFCLMALAFVIPLNRRFFPPIFTIYIISVICEGNFKAKWHHLRNRQFRLFLVGYLVLYATYVSGLIWSHNYPYAYQDLLLKLPILLFPFCLLTSDTSIFTYRKLLHLMHAFLAGCVVYSIYVFYVWIFKVGVDGILSAFRISGTGLVIHHSYISMCYILAIAIIFYLLHYEHKKFWFNILLVVIALVLVFQIIVLSSRTAWIVSGLLLTVFFVVWLVQTIRKRVRPYWTILFFSMVLAVALFLGSVPSHYNRCLNTIQNVKAEKSLRAADIRWSIWECSWDVIGEHPFLGVGTGDVRDSLSQRQMEVGLPSFNSHNQFLNTWVSVGIFGFLAFVMILVLSVRQAIRNRSFLYLSFLVIIIINCMTEAILEKQTGLVFFVFFNTYLYCFVDKNRSVASQNRM